jgi:CPA1 family monovalent cation:H+ antiporter
MIPNKSSLMRILFITAMIVVLSACSVPQLSTVTQPNDQVGATSDLLNSVGSESLEGSTVESGETTGEDNTIIVIEEIVIALLFIATVVGILTRRLRVPYTVGLVLMGLALALIPQVEVSVPRNLILGLLVPPLIFEASFHLNVNDLQRNLAPILAWAIPGVILTMVLVGAVVAWGTRLPITNALLFGAIVAATDPIAVIALFGSLGVPKRLQVLLEGESLFNDGTAIVLFGLMTTIALTGQFNFALSLIDFIRIAGGGLIVGLILAGLVSQLVSRIDDHSIETTLTTVLAFGSYLIAEEVFHVSGVLAVVAAGLISGNIGPNGMSPTTRIVVFNFWDYASFLANSFAFLLIGLQIDLPVLFNYWQPITTAILAVLVARGVVVYGLAWTGRDIPLKWQHTLFWGGLRGAISLALALGLPLALGSRDQLQVMTFGVVVFTLLVQGFSMGPLVKTLRLNPRSVMQIEYERRHARAFAVKAAYDHLEKLVEDGLISNHTWQNLAPILEEHNQTMVQAVKYVMDVDPNVEAEELETARREALRAQRSTLSDLLKDRIISDETYAQLVSEVDAALSDPTAKWPELIRHRDQRVSPINRLMAVVIQEQDFENALSALTKLGLSITHLPTVGGFLGRRNVTMIIGFEKGQEVSIVNALKRSCQRRVEYVSTPLEGTPLPLPSPVPITVGGATLFIFDVERYEEC